MTENGQFDDVDVLEEVVGQAAVRVPEGTSRFCAFEGVEIAAAPPEDRTHLQISDQEMTRRKQEVGGRGLADILREL